MTADNSTATLRNNFLEFFRAQDHKIMPSASLIPNDPTIMLNIAGMVPFKPYFLGEAQAPFKRVASNQKCVRTNDVENVGLTTRHLTYFEMLGNFSFGDYFKSEAINFAWKLSITPVEEGGWGLEPDRIWASVYQDDEVAYNIWKDEVGLPEERIVRMGPEDNFWSTGGAGPCGPCSELYYDRGPDHGPEGGPEVNEHRYIEYYNLVFNESIRSAGGDPKLAGTDVIVGPLDQTGIDTGAGLERIAMIKQDVPNVYEIDVIRPIMDKAIELTGATYVDTIDPENPNFNAAVWLRIIADHCRSAAFLICDGVLPSNEGRGYILRLLLRRAVRSGKMLGREEPFIGIMMEKVIEVLGGAWPDLHSQHDLIVKVAVSEETAFERTLKTGLAMLNTEITNAKATASTVLDAQAAFTLHDTYGFPVELTIEIAQEAGLTLNTDEFAEHMQQQRERARKATKSGKDASYTEAYKKAAEVAGVSTFMRDQTSTETIIMGIMQHGELVNYASEGDQVDILLRRTPFYPEGGGQLGDHGTIATDLGRVRVTDTITPAEGLILHRGTIEAGEINVSHDAVAKIDTARRESISQGHTATHLLHASIKELLGDHAVQAGSAIDQGRFRFDFPHFESLSKTELASIEALVNDRIMDGAAIVTEEMSQEDARKRGATALFGEKYGDQVRVVSIGDYSLELCGGTHVHSTANVGLFTIISEGSIANNVRRIEAIQGREALAYLGKERIIAQEIGQLLKVPTAQAMDKIADMIERIAHLEKDNAKFMQAQSLTQAQHFIDKAVSTAQGKVVSGVLPNADHDTLRSVATALRDTIKEGVVLLGTKLDSGKALMMCAVSASIVANGINAADVLRPGAKVVGGGAGGRGDIAQAGGKEGDKIEQALQVSVQEAQTLLG